MSTLQVTGKEGRLIHLYGLDQHPPATRHLLTVLDLDPSNEVARAARGALSEIDRDRGGARLH